MFPLAITLNAESTPDSRTTAFVTYRKHSVKIVQHDYQLDECVTVIQLALSFVIFDFN